MTTSQNHDPFRCVWKLIALCVLCLFLTAPVLAQSDVEEVTVMLPNAVSMVLVKIPAGTFMMGSPDGERGNVFNNETQHQVTLSKNYYLGKTEITQEQWEAVMGTPMRSECGAIAVGDKYPVYCVNWNRIAGPGGFMEKLNALLQTDGYRLPTEAEWEHGARANTTTRFSHGDVLECSDECGACPGHDPFMWWCGNLDSFAPQFVGQKQANPFGLHDMHGNLWEVVNDRYEEFSTAPVTDPTGAGGNGDVVMRGGGREAYLNRSASRLNTAPDDRSQNNEVGFRIAISADADLGFKINAGLNDAWFDPKTNGQGFFITVYPDIKQMYLAWFTYDTERPPEDVTAILGDPGHRWLTALGPYEGNTATLTIYVTKGGVFNSVEPPTTTDLDGDGTMTFVFEDCEAGLMTYHIESLDLDGDVPIQRVADDNIPLCQVLASEEIIVAETRTPAQAQSVQ